MAPLTEQVVTDLKNTISSLEARVQELESRLAGGVGAASGTPEGKRLILMGPPGAGECQSLVQESGEDIALPKDSAAKILVVASGRAFPLTHDKVGIYT